MTHVAALHGRSVPAGKTINLAQLEAEVNAAGVATSGLGMLESVIYTYDADGGPVDFAAAQQVAVEQCIAAHVAMRDKTDAELSEEFQATDDPAAKQDLRDQMSGLLPREQVPM